MRESQQGDLDQRSLIAKNSSVTALGHHGLEEGTNWIGRPVGGLRVDQSR